MIFKKVLVALITLCFVKISFSQNSWIQGQFPFKNFNLESINASPQILAGTASSDNTIFIGNNQSIFVYNSVNWDKVPIVSSFDPKIKEAIDQSTVHQIIKASNGDIIIGRRNSIGKIVTDENGFYAYQPFYYKKDAQTFEEMIRVVELRKNTYAIFNKNEVILFENNRASKIPLPADVQDVVITHVESLKEDFLVTLRSVATGKQKYAIFNSKLAQFKGKPIVFPALEYDGIVSSLQHKGTCYYWSVNGKVFTCQKNEKGEYQFSAPSRSLLPSLANEKVYQIEKRGDYYYINVVSKGIYMTDLDFNIVRIFSYNDGLEGSLINHFFFDLQDNLWLLQDKGIHFMELSSPISLYGKNRGIKEGIESVSADEKRIFVGTGDDLLIANKEDKEINFVKNEAFKDVVFDFQYFDTDYGRKYLCISFSGIYEFDPKSNNYTFLNEIPAWRFHQYTEDRNVIYVGLVGGLGKIEVTPNGLVYTDVIAGLNGDVISVKNVGELIYFGERGAGLHEYNVRTGERKLFSIDKEYNKKSYYCVSLLKDKVFVGCQSGLYLYNKQKGKLEIFVDEDKYLKFDPNLDIHILKNENDKHLWVVWNTKIGTEENRRFTGYLTLENGKAKIFKWPYYLIDKASVTNDIYFESESLIWLGGWNGLYVFNRDKAKEMNHQFKVIIDKVWINNSERFGNPKLSKNFGRFDFEENTIRFSFRSNSYVGNHQIVYSVKLEGYDDWSEYSENNQVAYSKLHEGEYILKIKAKDVYGFESEVTSLSFRVFPPWYRTWYAYLAYAILVFVFIRFVVKISTQRIKRQNQMLEETVKERTKEIASQNEQLEEQKAELTRKSNDILDSIKYAKRIQNTILPTETKLGEMFHEHFVFYVPKDIVSGDFYWAKKVDHLDVFGVFDCTGHGVPGALVSIVGNNALVRAINEFQLRSPESILDKMRDLVISSFKTDGNQHLNDGMDAALCTIDAEKNKLYYSGANNECIVIRNGEIFELTPNKQPVGEFIYPKPFVLHEFDLEPGDVVYLYSDGYVDQFGGPKGKKFKSGTFKKLLLDIAKMPMNEQMTIIQSTFYDWKGELDQVDDVCVLGVRFK